MKLFPAIDILDGRAVRLFRGDYNAATVYSDSPVSVARDFERDGAEYLHIVDLEGARSGTPACLDIMRQITAQTDLFVEVGGGVRSLDTVKALADCGVSRVILGTAAVEDTQLLRACLECYGEKTAVGADIRDGCIAVKGWTSTSAVTVYDFFEQMQQLGVTNIICTDISKDGAMSGTNTALYRELSERFSVSITASGGVSTLDDIRRLADMNIYAAILGKALYTGALKLKEALESV